MARSNAALAFVAVILLAISMRIAPQEGGGFLLVVASVLLLITAVRWYFRGTKRA